jgi:hypothetical protein
MYDTTLKIIAVAKVKANIVIHICSSIAWQAGAQPVSQPPAPGAGPLSVMDESLRLIESRVSRKAHYADRLCFQ